MGISFLTADRMEVPEFARALQEMGFKPTGPKSYRGSHIECFIEGSRECSDGLSRVLCKIDLDENNVKTAVEEQDVFVATVGAHCSQDADDGDDAFTRLLYGD